MAKAGFWLRGARGKLAGASVGKGSQGGTVIREIVAPKNPQTLSQMIQRILWNTVVQAYSFCKPIADHSFEGFAEGSETMQQFVKRNMAAIRARLKQHTDANMSINSFYNVTALGDNTLAYNPFLISHGTLPQVLPSLNNDGSMSIVVSGNTYGDVIESLGLQRGDQLTFVMVGLTQSGAQKFFYSRVILDPVQAGAELPLGTVFCQDNAPVYPSARNEGSFSVLSYENGALKFNVAAATNTVIGGAVIVSRENGASNWLRSTAHLTFSEQHQLSLFDAYQMAANGVSVASDLYLNNAGEGNQISGQASYEPTISVLTFDGQNALLQSATTTNTAAGARTIEFTASNMTELTNPRLVAVSGSSIPEEGITVNGAAGIAISNGSGTGTVTLSAGTYRLVLIDANSESSNNGNVVAVYGRVVWDNIM